MKTKLLFNDFQLSLTRLKNSSLLFFVLSSLFLGSNAFAYNNDTSVNDNVSISTNFFPDGGEIICNSFQFCVDGEADYASGLRLEGNAGQNSQWVITDTTGKILGLPDNPEMVNFDEAGPGVCLIWHLSYSNGLTGLEVGNNATTDLNGTYDFSNDIKVYRNQPEGGNITGGPFEFIVGDGEEDFIWVEVNGNSGANAQWVITDEDGKILGLPYNPETVNFDEAGAGVCLVWHLSYENHLTGLKVGNNATTDLDGCYDFSDPVKVIRKVKPEAGEIAGGPFSFCVDGEADYVSGITLDGTGVGTNSSWVITDDQGNILGLPPTLADVEGVDFDDAGAGICLIWYLRFEDGLEGAEKGKNANDLKGYFDLSNPLTVVRSETHAGEISGGPFEFFVDGQADYVSGITLDGTGVGTNSSWVITDDQGNILGLPPTLADVEGVDFDGAGAGTCLIWYLRFEDGLEGAMKGKNANDLKGCFDLSNSLTVVRKIHVNGGEIEGGPFSFCVGDGEADYVSGIELTWDSGANSQWVITDDTGKILGLPNSPEEVNFDGAGDGVCLIWHLSYDDGLVGLKKGNNALTDLFGTYDFSNNIHVYRNQPEAGDISGGPFEFIAIDGVPDYVSGITLDGKGVGANSTWVITDDQGNILGLPPTLKDVEGVNFDGAGVGTCLIWYLRFEDGLIGAEEGLNANDLEGCFDLSNPIEVVRNSVPDKNALSVYPIPATDVLKLAMNKMESVNMNVALYDFSGSDITNRMQRTNTETEVVFNLKSLPQGIYILKVNDGKGKSFTRKVVVR